MHLGFYNENIIMVHLKEMNCFKMFTSNLENQRRAYLFFFLQQGYFLNIIANY